MRFWSDLSMSNKYGLAAVGAIVVVAIIALVLL
jgi:flagellar biosynthesis/type III secretory pathway M-ring protein FliF/YscJ